MVEIVEACRPDTTKAIDTLIKESNKRWQEEEPVIDDTTIIVAYL